MGRDAVADENSHDQITEPKEGTAKHGSFFLRKTNNTHMKRLFPKMVLALSMCCSAPLLRAQEFPFRNPELPIEERVRDLIS